MKFEETEGGWVGSTVVGKASIFLDSYAYTGLHALHFDNNGLTFTIVKEWYILVMIAYSRSKVTEAT